MKSPVELEEPETAGFRKKAKKVIQRNIHQSHRILGIITIIPVILWTLSGLMHPFMANYFKPVIPSTFLIPKPVNPEQVSLEPRDILESNGLVSFKNLRLVTMENESFYQVKLMDDQIEYFNARTGERFPDGDIKYAEYLARYFLEDLESPVKNIQIQEEFDGQYQYINRLLPVWRIDFDRADNMTMYIETTSDRLGTFNPTSRKVFIWFFSTFHKWGWLEAITGIWWRTTIMIVCLCVIIGSAISGLVIYGLMWKRIKRPSAKNRKGALRKYHREIGLATAFVTLTFAFSGAYQATRSYKTDILPEMVYEPEIRTADLKSPLFSSDMSRLKILNIGVVRSGNNVYYQLQCSDCAETGTSFEYYHAENGTYLPDGDRVYASFLAGLFAEKANLPLTDAAVMHAQKLTGFTHDYGFVFKRLPVQQLDFDTDEKHSLFIETSTSRLAASITNADRIQGFTFAVLHKFFLLDWAGKTIRDLVMMLSALGVLVVSVLGLAVFLKF